MRNLWSPYRAKKRAVKKGDVILTSTPFAHVVNHQYVSMYCYNCIISHRDKRILSRCQGCRTLWYCSDQCQREDWALHSFECHNLRRLSPYVPQDFVRLMARVIMRLRDGGDKIVEMYSEREGRRFRNLMNHYADIKQNKERLADADYLIEELKRYIGEEYIPNYSDFLGIYGRMLVNRFSLMDRTMMTLGSAMYLSASIFDHSCIPNCFISFAGKNVQIRTLIDMPVLDYCKCRISYVDPVSSVRSRRENLYHKWFFWCECSLCENQERTRMENSIMCENAECRAPIYIPETGEGQAPAVPQAASKDGHQETSTKETTARQWQWRMLRDQQRNTPAEGDQQKVSSREVQQEGELSEERQQEPVCSECGCSVSSATLRRYQDAVDFTKEKLKSMSEEDPNVEECLEMIEKQGSIFHPFNVWRFRTLDFAFNVAVFNGFWSRALAYGEENLKGMRYCYGSDHPTFCLFLFKLGKAKIYFKEFREGLRLLEEAEPQLKIALGPDHYILEDLNVVSLLANEDVEICMERRNEAYRKQNEVEMEAKDRKKTEKKQLQIFNTITLLGSTVTMDQKSSL
nr:LOW QUALITY PROTEIN: uncharacterized protein LOC128684235 [Cherax quadricarinatus]